MKVRTIDLPIEAVFPINLPVGSRLLRVDTHGGAPVLYALCSDDKKVTGFDLRIVVNGEEADLAEDATYLGTAHLRADLSVHVFAQ